MARDSQYVQIGKRKLEISNLKKVLYPESGIVKAEVIQYYLTIAPTMLFHIKGRALSLVRFPEGIDGERFFQKNRPEWAPDWLEYVSLGSDQKKDYIIATEEASLVWLANMACLELHQMQTRRPHHDLGDYIVYDLDPPEGYDFEGVKDIAFDLKAHIEGYGYQCFVKTTGGKGLHLITPVQAKWTVDECFDAAKEVAQPFSEKRKDTTLNIKKDARKGRVLIDIYRNRSSQTIIAPYSLRGYPGAPVSMPVTWEELEDLESSQAYNIRTAPKSILERGDAWEGIGAYAVPLHTKRKTGVKKDLGPNKLYKSPRQLEDYSKKRDFAKTPEPKALFSGGDNTGFVVHRHHASHLHYDLRLEQDGVLRSWAVPKGLPAQPGIKRLAMATEDHPMEYITFEGEIPKGQYGGGKMWIYANGRYAITKQKKDGFYFTLNSPQINAEYRMHNTKGKEWLLERVDTPQVDWLKTPVQPMLADTAKKVPVGDEYIYELKWDGIRALIVMDEGEVTIWSRNHKKLNKQFPELMVAEKAFRGTSAVFDAEIVCFDTQGKPDFKTVIHRMQRTGDTEIERSSKKYPAYCYVFDCLYLDGRALINEPLARRREWMEDSLRRDTPYRISEAVQEGKELYNAAKKMQLEGIIAKDINSRYLPGKRTGSWLKVKVKQTTEALIIGYSWGKGDREGGIGALHLGQYEGGELVYRGKVGTGFNEKTLKEAFTELSELPEIERPVKEKPVTEANTIWIEPRLYCELQYSMITNNGSFREPVFLRMRPDLSE
ncbi:ATP-dependent DNA ligase clustered with Ku protein, LigD [Fulvivirga imtechensis AK7]|uniref:DNA ligase (ATP) n=1 Tax=Fulvivirga imtechensis AK7 TaxID=1237149 RepID=L8K363_9BACT|nr:non-homologous end-joining DNA ligase [Fulvivirga imtechensis]ELR73907.1 ATP-dependent DNA ligase clustered with Ku protein, LigD [Fulvivirga imtechensis AK7]